LSQQPTPPVPLNANFSSDFVFSPSPPNMPYIPPVVDILDSGCRHTDSENDEIMEVDVSFNTEPN